MRLTTPHLAVELDPVFEGALCAQTDPDLWFPPPGGDPEPAKRICDRCPARQPCLDWALAHDVTGVWGGTTEAERIRARRNRRRRKT